MSKKLTIEKIENLREALRFQLEPRQAYAICRELEQGSNFLVFGMGYDTALWTRANELGRTVFLEDNKEWFGKIKKMNPNVEGYLIDYGTKITEWKDIADKKDKLGMKLPSDLDSVEWDVILVDAPCGALEYSLKEFGQEPPGRMKSIYMASRLIKNGGQIFVNDCHREVEIFFCDKYLKDENFVRSYGTLRHYLIKNK